MELAARLDKHSDPFLRMWKDRLRAEHLDAGEVLAAMAELMVQVTGKTGFWRKMAPAQWFGCHGETPDDVCKKLEKAEPQFRKADALQVSVMAVSHAGATQYIRKNSKKLLEYIDTFVPMDASMSGAQATGFYTAHLQ